MGHSPDTLCHCLGQCRVDPGQEMCHFYPKPSGRPVCPIMNQSKLEKVKNDMRETLVDWSRWDRPSDLIAVNISQKKSQETIWWQICQFLRLSRRMQVK